MIPPVVVQEPEVDNTPTFVPPPPPGSTTTVEETTPPPSTGGNAFGSPGGSGSGSSVIQTYKITTTLVLLADYNYFYLFSS